MRKKWTSHENDHILIRIFMTIYENFKNCFDVFYLSHEIKLRKPTTEIFDFVLSNNNLNAEETLFIDDNQDNITTAKQLGYNIWHINPETEDVINLFKIKKDIF